MTYQLCVFDLDHTLLTVNCSFKFGLYLFRKNFFGWKNLIQCLIYYARHKWCGMSIDKLHQKSFDSLFKGHSLETVQRLAKSFLEEEFDQFLYNPVYERLQEALKQGDICAVFSSSPNFLVGPIAEKLGIFYWEGTTYCLDAQGTFVAIKEVMEGEVKAERLQALADKLGVTRSSITVYSDSYLDLPVLKSAGKAIAVLPDRRLKRFCLENGWEIL